MSTVDLRTVSVCLFLEHNTLTPVEKEVSTGQHSHMTSGSERLIVFEPGHLGYWPAVRRPAGERNIFSSPHRQVCGMLDETPFHLWKNKHVIIIACN